MRNINMLFNILFMHVFMLGTIASPSTTSVIDVCGDNTSLFLPFANISTKLKADVQNITINFCSGDSFLRGDLSFINKTVVSLVGERHSVLTCYGQSAGISFENVNFITLWRVVIKNCGSLHTIGKDNFSSSILIQKCANFSMWNSSILNSQGVGMVILQSYAVIDIVNCTFRNGSSKNTSCGGGGLYLDLYCSPKSIHCNYRVSITNSHFQNNHARIYNHVCPNMKLDNGGGLSCKLSGNTSDDSVTIQDSTFESNKAKWGGGLNVLINQWSSNNTVSVQNCTFYKNEGFGGGGLNIGYWFKSVSDVPRYNKIILIDTKFEDNYASRKGGGMVFFSTMSQPNAIESNEAFFMNCLWKNNRARYASAVSLDLWNQGTYSSREHLPLATFKDCTLEGNQILDHKTYTDSAFYEYMRGKGCFFSVGYKVLFNSSMRFINNTGSALYLASSTVEIHSNNEVSFIGNKGYYGGAVCLFGSSILHVHDDITLRFIDNTATVKGGAIYQEHEDTLEYISLKKCFLHYFNPRSNNSNISCLFKNNKVIESGTSSSSLTGNSIYMHSLRSCETITNFTLPVIKNNETNHIEYVGPVAHFVFDNSTGNELSTAGTKFKVKMNITHRFPITPGKVTDLPIEVNDDFDRTVFRVYEAILKTDALNRNNMSLESSSTHIYQNKLLLYGTPGGRGNVSFSLSSIGDDEVILRVVLRECPPGYVSENKSGLVSCTCSLDTLGKHYFGISSCNHSTFQAVLKQGYWLGCNDIDTDNESCHEYIVSHTCPRNFCLRNGSLTLPNTSSVLELDRVICGMERSGVLCGKCQEGHSAFYHSEDLRCIHHTECKLGWLFYILSEILPVTLFFLVVIVWDVQFTTGSIQGFILYSQLFGTLLISANGQLPQKQATNSSLFILKLFLDLFNLDFFVQDRLSFCLWTSASSLDILTFKYVTVLYAFSLVLLTIILLNSCRLGAMDRLLKKIRGGKEKNISTSIIHGLSGFLVICYSQCTKISLLILTPATIYSSESVQVKRVAFYGGELTYLSGKHLLYAIPAMLVLALIILLPILLLIYPLCYKIFSLMKIEESKFARILCRVAPLERLKPFFDSFQSCFRDDCRYFSGLYFTYRLSTILSFAAFQSLLLYYVIVEIQFVLMLAAHSWVQPYTTSWHNKLDTLVFITLIIVNLLTLFRYSHTYDADIDIVRHIENIQIAIAYLPLLYLAVYIFRKIALKIRIRRYCCSGNEKELVSPFNQNDYQEIST